MRVSMASFVVGLGAATAAAPAASAEEHRWNVDVGVRGVASIAVDDEPMGRVGAVPSMTIRTSRALGTLYLGFNLAAGFPVYAGQHEASVTMGLTRTIREGRCTRVDFDAGLDFDLDADLECDARLVILGGVDAGVTMLHYDAPPELSATSDALLYWGPLARGRVAIRATWPTPTGKAIGFTVGAGIAVTSASYMTTATGNGLRLEPELDIAGVIGF